MPAKKNTLENLTKDDLVKKLEEISSELNRFYSLPKEKIEKPRQKSTLRHERARILTLLTKQANT